MTTYIVIIVGIMKELMLNQGEDLQVVLFVIFLILFSVLEWWSPRRKAENSQTVRRANNALLTVLVIICLPLLPVSFITAAMWAESNQFGLFNLIALPEPVVFILAMLVRGFISFFTHMLNHKIPALWRIHRVHHLDTGLDVSSTVRFHPLEMPISMLIGLPVVVAFGLSPWMLLFYELLDVSVTLFSHSNVTVPAKINRFLRYFIVTPNLHLVHHSVVRNETDSNYSAVFPNCDLVFGTFRTEAAVSADNMTLGLGEVRDGRTNNFLWLMVSPFIRLSPEPAVANHSAGNEERLS